MRELLVVREGYYDCKPIGKLVTTGGVPAVPPILREELVGVALAIYQCPIHRLRTRHFLLGNVFSPHAISISFSRLKLTSKTRSGYILELVVPHTKI